MSHHYCLRRLPSRITPKPYPLRKRKRSQPCRAVQAPIQKLPIETLEGIFTNLDRSSIGQLLLTCRKFHDVIKNSSSVWNRLIATEIRGLNGLPAHFPRHARLIFSRLLAPYKPLLSARFFSWKYGALTVEYCELGLVGFSKLGPIREKLFRLELDPESGEVSTWCDGSESKLQQHRAVVSIHPTGFHCMIKLRCLNPRLHRTVDRSRCYDFRKQISSSSYGS